MPSGFYATKHREHPLARGFSPVSYPPNVPNRFKQLSSH